MISENISQQKLFYGHLDDFISQKFQRLKLSCFLVQISQGSNNSPWNFLSQNTGVGSLALLQGIFLT